MMAVLRNGSPPVAFCKIGRDGTEYLVSIVRIADDGTEMSIWDAAQDGKPYIVFKSYDGMITYSSAWYQPGATVVKPTAPTREPTGSGETKTVYTFAGWSTSMNSTSGTTGAITAGSRSMTYYAAFEATTVEPLYLVQDGVFQIDPVSHRYSSNSSGANFYKVGNTLQGGGIYNGVCTWDSVDYKKYSKIRISASISAASGGEARFVAWYTSPWNAEQSNQNIFSAWSGNTTTASYSGTTDIPTDAGTWKFGFGYRGAGTNSVAVYTINEVVLLP